MLLGNCYINELLEKLRLNDTNIVELLQYYIRKLPGDILLVNGNFEYEMKHQTYIPYNSLSIVQKSGKPQYFENDILLEKISELQEKDEFGNYLANKLNELSSYDIKLLFQYRYLNKLTIRKTMELSGFSQYLVQRYQQVVLEELRNIFYIS